MPDTAVYSTLRGPPWCRLFQCIILFAAYLVFLSYLIRWVSSDQTCKNNVLTLSGWNCLFWEHGVSLLYFLFFAVITIAVGKATWEAEDTGGIDNYEILLHSVNNIAVMPWTVITWHRIGKVFSWLLTFGAGDGAEQPQWVESLFRIVGSSMITAIIYYVIGILLLSVLLVLAVVCFLTPIYMLRRLCHATSQFQRKTLLAQRRLKAMNIKIYHHNRNILARQNAAVPELVEGAGEQCTDEGSGDRSCLAEDDVERTGGSMFGLDRTISNRGFEPRRSLSSN